MGEVEWFRRSTWTPEDAADFAARLRRSRTPYNKAQYLRIQAGHLHQGGTRELTEAAMALLDQLVAEYPETSQLAAAHMLRAECLVDLGLPGDALDAYRRSLEEQRRTPRWRDLAYLGFGELALALQRRDLYDEALAALDEFGGDELFPVHEYRAAALRALIADECGDRDGAREWARRALAAASRTESPFRYHRKLGLVRTVDPDVMACLSRLAARSARE